MPTRVVVSTTDEEFKETARKALASRFDLAFCGTAFPELIVAAREAPLVVLDPEGSSDDLLRHFGKFRRLCPRARIVVVAPEVEAHIALDLLGCGAAEVLLDDTDARTLLRKVARALDGGRWSVYDATGLPPAPADLEPVQPTGPRERRAAIRVRPFGDVATRVVIERGNEAVLAQIHDIALELDGRPGGLAIAHSDAGLAQSTQETSFTAWLRTADDPTPIPLQLTLVRQVSGGPRAVTAFTYTLLQRGDSRRVRRFVASEQRKWQAHRAHAHQAAAAS